MVGGRRSGVALGGGALWMTRGSWMPRPADTVTVAPATCGARDRAGDAAGRHRRYRAAAKPPASVKAAIVSDPPGARVVREKDGAVIGMTPFRETWPSGDGVHKLRLELDGYRSETVVVPLDRGVDLSFALRKVAQPEPHKHKDAKHAPARPLPRRSPARADPGAGAPGARSALTRARGGDCVLLSPRRLPEDSRVSCVSDGRGLLLALAFAAAALAAGDDGAD